MYKCDTCGREFSTEAALAQHMKDKHGLEGTEVPKEREASRGSKAKQKSLRRKNRHPVALGLAAVAIVLGLGLYIVVAPNFAPTPVPCSTGENYIHVHPWIRIFVENTEVTVPSNVGYLNSRGCLEEIHTHDASGIIHVELSQADSRGNYTLGDFFKVWAVTFSSIAINGTSHPVVFANDNIFGFRTDATHRVVVLVDNKTAANPVGIPIEQLDYCDANIGGATGSPCYHSVGASNPLWDGTANYPYGTGHTIVIRYEST